MTRIPYRDTWAPVAGQSERTYRIVPWMAHPKKHQTRRDLAEAALFVLGLVAIVIAMSVDFA